MNSCLADLSHLIPSNYLKKGRGRIEKTEIVEMAIKHIKHLQELLPSSGTSGSTGSTSGSGGPEVGSESATNSNMDESKSGSNWQCPQEAESFKNGFTECLAESVHFLVEREHIPPENPICSRLVNHLKRHLEQKPGLAPVSGSQGANDETKTEAKASTSTELDSDYASFSDVGSTISNQSSANSTVLNSRRKFLFKSGFIFLT